MDVKGKLEYIQICHASRQSSPFSNLYIFTCNRCCCQLPDDCFVRGMKLQVAIKCFWTSPTPETYRFTNYIYIHTGKNYGDKRVLRFGDILAPLSRETEICDFKGGQESNALCITSSVTSAMLVMSDTPMAICSYALTNINARPRQCANNMITDAQAGIRITLTIVLICWKNARTSSIVSLMRCYSLNNYARV